MFTIKTVRDRVWGFGGPDLPSSTCRAELSGSVDAPEARCQCMCIQVHLYDALRWGRFLVLHLEGGSLGVMRARTLRALLYWCRDIGLRIDRTTHTHGLLCIFDEVLIEGCVRMCV